MSYERDRSSSEDDQQPAASSLPYGAGKASLADAAIQRKASPGGGMTGPGKGTRTGALPVAPGMRGAAGGSASEGATPAGERPGARDIGSMDEYEGAEAEPAQPFEPRITAPATGGGANVAATVVGSTAETELARDGGFTPALIAALHANPDASIDEVLQHVAASPIGAELGRHAVQHPTIVQYGRMPQGAGAAQGGEPAKKHAVLIANQSYESARDLLTPISEANQMKGELATRGYQVDVHVDKTAADMSALWGSLVGPAKPGDDLVAHFGGHGVAEGLLGVEHEPPPGKADLFTNAQVSGVVGAATGKGAHIRFVMDSCRSGGPVQAVRDVRQNELAAAASSPDDKRRVDVLASLRAMKQRLLGLREQRHSVPGELRAALEQHTARPPDPANVEATRAWSKIGTQLREVVAFWVERHDREEEQVWADIVPQLEAVRAIERYAAPPPPISDYSLGAQINYLDDLWNAVSRPVEQSIASAGGAVAGGAAAGGAASDGASSAGAATPPVVG